MNELTLIPTFKLRLIGFGYIRKMKNPAESKIERLSAKYGLKAINEELKRRKD